MPKKKLTETPAPGPDGAGELQAPGFQAEQAPDPTDPSTPQAEQDIPPESETFEAGRSSDGPEPPSCQTDPAPDDKGALDRQSSEDPAGFSPVPQSDRELGSDMGGPDTPLSGQVIADPLLHSQPDLEMSDLELARAEEREALQDDSDVVQGPAAGALPEGPEPPSHQTDREPEGESAFGSKPAADPPVPQTDQEADAEGGRVPATESPQPEPGEGVAVRAPRPKVKAPSNRGPKVVAIDEQRQVETDADKLKNDLLDLAESLKGKRILTGTIQGVEQAGDNPNLIYAVVYHGSFKVIIPALSAVFEPVDYRDQPKNEVLYYLLNKRLGAEVDYIVQGVDTDSGIAVASRLEAMAQKRKDYYFRADRDGNYQLYEGVCAEARVTSVIRAGMFVDLFGAECYIPLAELSYQRWMDATTHYQPGQRVLVKILEIDRSDRDNLQVTVSVKQAAENPYEQALKRFVVGMRYVGTVSLVNLTGVFVSLEGGIDCLCTYPKRGRPPRGAQVTVRILGIDTENNHIWGVITHMSGLR